MYFRQLFYSKVGQLCRERKVLLQHMGGEQGISNMVLDDAGVRLSEMSGGCRPMALMSTKHTCSSPLPYHAGYAFSCSLSHHAAALLGCS